MAPRQPVENDEILCPILGLFEEGPGLRLGLLARGQHPLGVDHRLRRSGRAGREQEFCDRVGRDGGKSLRDFRSFRRARDGMKGQRAFTFTGDDHSAVQRRDGGERGGERRLVDHIDRAGIEQRDHALELVEIPRHQRIGRRDCRRGTPTCIAASANSAWSTPLSERMTSGRSALMPWARIQLAIERDLPQRRAIGHGPPRRFDRRTVREENSVGCLARPVFEPVADTARTRLQRHRRFEPDRPVGAVLGDHARRREQGLGPHRAGCVVIGFLQRPL